MWQALFVFILGLMSFALTQCILKLILEPIGEVRSSLSKIVHCMMLYDLEITNLLYKREAESNLLLCAADLRSSVNRVMFYDVVCRVRFLRLPTKWNVAQACLCLAIIARNLALSGKDCHAAVDLKVNNERQRDEIAKLLKLPTRMTTSNAGQGGQLPF